jgi:hypothetical protein
MKTTSRGIAAALGLALVALSAGLDGSLPRERSPALAVRLLGPLARTAARAQWVRAREAMAAGRTDLALARAATALELDPGNTAGWSMLAWHLAMERGSLQREPAPERRAVWLRAGLDATRRGEAVAREPAELALERGLMLAQVADEDAPPPWPGGAEALWREAAEAFERARALGHADGAELAEIARARAAVLAEPPPPR